MYTQKLIIATIALVIGLGFGAALAGYITTQTDYGVDSEYLYEKPVDTALTEFKIALTVLLDERNEMVVSLEPETLMNALPLIVPADFDNVEAVVGKYLMVDGALAYTNTEITDEAANDITDTGLAKLRGNIYRRLGYTAELTTYEVIKALQGVVEGPAPDEPVSSDDMTDDFVACTMDAMQCPDGSFVGRIAPDCRFADCPGPNQQIVCTPEQKEAEACIEIYAPVCASVQVECITAPCNPVPQTFPNSCFACAEDRVISYTDGGACPGDPTAY